MAINFQKLDQRTNKVTFEYGEQSMEVEYRPSAIAKDGYFARLDEIKADTSMKESDRENASILYQLETAVVSWELVDEKGEVVKPSLELVQAIEKPFWYKLLQTVDSDLARRFDAKKG
jgi:hypothetical protein